MSVGLPVEGASVMICSVVPMVGLIILLFLFCFCFMVPSQLVFRTKTELKWPLGKDTSLQVVVNLPQFDWQAHTYINTHTLLASYVS